MTDATMVLDCGHGPDTTQGSGYYGTGYGVGSDGRTYCYNCCEARDRASLASTGRGVAYLSGDGRTVTGWPGYVLGHVTREYQTREGFGGRTTRIYARIDGRTYSGRGAGRNMILSLRVVR